MNNIKLHPIRLGVFGLMSLLDLFLTYRLLQSGNGVVYESNPIAEAWLKRFDWAGLALFKLLSMSIVITVVIFVSLHRPRTGSHLLTFACLAVSGVVIYSFSLTNVVGKGPDSSRSLLLAAAESEGNEAQRSFRDQNTFSDGGNLPADPCSDCAERCAPLADVRTELITDK